MFELAVIGALYLFVSYSTVAYWMWDCTPTGINDWLTALTIFVLAPVSVPIIEFLRDWKKGI